MEGEIEKEHRLKRSGGSWDPGSEEERLAIGEASWLRFCIECEGRLDLKQGKSVDGGNEGNGGFAGYGWASQAGRHLSKRGKPEQFQGLRDSQARQNHRLHSVAEIR